MIIEPDDTPLPDVTVEDLAAHGVDGLAGWMRASGAIWRTADVKAARWLSTAQAVAQLERGLGHDLPAARRALDAISHDRWAGIAENPDVAAWEWA